MIMLAIDVLQLGADRLGVTGGEVLALVMDFLEHRADLLAEAARGPAQMRLEDLAEVHAARHTQRVEDDIGMRHVLEERHVRSEEQTSELKSPMRTPIAVFGLKIQQYSHNSHPD